jgi:hypothetical protein
MRLLSLALMLLGLLLIAGSGLMGFFLLVMSFDAPDSAADPLGWLLRLLLFLPVLLLAGLLAWAFRAYQAGNFVRSASIGSLFALLLLGGLAYAAAIFDGKKQPIGGLLGYLDEARTGVELAADPSPRIRQDELPQFKDAQGRSFAERYPVQP